jgi:hypothetical protein
VEASIENWPLKSGTWQRDAGSDAWRLAATRDGAVVNPRLPVEDVGRLTGAMKDGETGQWFPSDFTYSPSSGAKLQPSSAFFDSPWVPPFGADALADTSRPLGRGLRQTPSLLAFGGNAAGRSAASAPDRTLPALPPGRHEFVVHRCNVESSTLIAIEPAEGRLLLFLPESKAWLPLEPDGEPLARCRADDAGWRMEVVEGPRNPTLYLPTTAGLAVVVPSVIAVSYSATHVGGAAAKGGPVAWDGHVWLPVDAGEGVVNVIGYAGNQAPIVITVRGVPALRGMESPVFDPLQVIWPSDEGQLVLRIDPDGRRAAEWMPWPDGLHPVFTLGCPYLSEAGSFWQVCRADEGDEGTSLTYVRMGKLHPETSPAPGPRLSTGRVSYQGRKRIESQPWGGDEPNAGPDASAAVFPLIESVVDHVVVGLRIEAPQGVMAILASEGERFQAVLQQEGVNGVTEFGTLDITRPWLTTVFVYDACLWIAHPDLPHVLGWQLEN